jgi:hypothetical protein
VDLFWSKSERACKSDLSRPRDENFVICRQNKNRRNSAANALAKVPSPLVVEQKNTPTTSAKLASYLPVASYMPTTYQQYVWWVFLKILKIEPGWVNDYFDSITKKSIYLKGSIPLGLLTIDAYVWLAVKGG